MGDVMVNVKDQVLRPIDDVFDAIVDPTRMACYFISSGSGMLESGATVEWQFADVGGTLTVEVQDVEVNRRIIFDWAASGAKARVTIELEEADSDTTLVAINEAGWPMDHEGVQRALQQTQGWTDFLCCMKAYLQHGLNLRHGRTANIH